MKVLMTENEESSPLELSAEDFDFLASLKDPFQVRKVGAKSILKAENFIGCMTLPSGLNLEIHPKIGFFNVFRILTRVSNLYNPLASSFQFDQDCGLLDVIGQAFCDELVTLIRGGLLKGYSPIRENLKAVRGRILFQSLSSTESASDPSSVPCSFTRLSFDCLEHSFIAAAKETLLHTPQLSTKVRVGILEAWKNFPSIAKSNASLIDFRRLSISRHNQRYTRVLQLSQIILEMNSLTSRSGIHRGRAFLINLAPLFEKYVELLLREQSGSFGMSIASQKDEFLDMGSMLVCRPDLVFLDLDSKAALFVGDTKYKFFSGKPKEADAYQCLAYMINRRCYEAVLIYPSLGSAGGESQGTNFVIEHGSQQFKISVGYVNLGSETESSSDCAVILNKLIKRIGCEVSAFAS
jgi:5-methylcytosine-specific restriction enzyme subunit McrC